MKTQDDQLNELMKGSLKTEISPGFTTTVMKAIEVERFRIQRRQQTKRLLSMVLFFLLTAALIIATVDSVITIPLRLASWLILFGAKFYLLIPVVLFLVFKRIRAAL